MEADAKGDRTACTARRRSGEAEFSCVFARVYTFKHREHRGKPSMTPLHVRQPDEVHFLARWNPQTDAEREAVRSQLQRLLNSPLFNQSRRYSTLLRYIVERSLEGEAEMLKERTLGVEVFGREPYYDASADPVVRTTAAQLRRRIAQYYFGPGHEQEIVIDLPTGGYTPAFHLPGDAQQPTDVLFSETSPAPSALATGIVPAPSVPARRNTSTLLLWALVVAVLAMASISLARILSKPSALSAFWKPVLDAQSTILVCTGVPTLNAEELVRAKAEELAGLTIRQSLHANTVAWPDAVTFSAVASLIGAKGRTYQSRKSAVTSLSDLRGAPAVLVGGYNNQWIMRLGLPLRFHYAKEPNSGRAWIEDRANPSQQSWSNDFSAPFAAMNRDFGVIARVLDPTTERPIVIVSGIAAYGTVAAGEFVTNEKYMQMIAAKAPKGWERKNIEVVFATRVINANSGPPEILAMHFW